LPVNGHSGGVGRFSIVIPFLPGFIHTNNGSIAMMISIRHFCFALSQAFFYLLLIPHYMHTSVKDTSPVLKVGFGLRGRFGVVVIEEHDEMIII
jgi:hypothetical protein